MSENAAGQLMGYTLQFPRALYHLTMCEPGEMVCVEYLGDVAIEKDGVVRFSEEDKSSIHSNPVTDKSVDLWKTLYNWVNSIASGEFTSGKTIFLLYTNKKGRKGIAEEFSEAQDKDQVNQSINNAISRLSGLEVTHPIWYYYNHVINKNRAILEFIVMNFELRVGSDTGIQEVKERLLAMHVPESQIDFMCDKLSGWLQKNVLEKISNKNPAKVTWKEFNQEFSVVFERIMKRELIDFTSIIEEEDVNKQVKKRPLYLKQLEEIDEDEEGVIEAVTEYMKAETNRGKWIENGIIDANVADEFEHRLIEQWRNEKKLVDLTNVGIDEKTRGKILLYTCKKKEVRIRDMDPPSSTTAGTYHYLADEPVLGWHPNWKTKFIDGS
ncbi:hypothetical protein A6P54_02545 [Bacillus sp. MKU004]|nr:hypothetical protein A6P54_02545 [Bacillus sp. MKU004]